jgi:hypothetical protein
MLHLRFGAIFVALVAATVSQARAGKQSDSETESPAEAVRKGLDQAITLDFTSQSIQEAVQHLKEKTKINFVLDVLTLQQMGILLDENGNPIAVHLKVEKGKVRQGLQRILEPYNLTYVILGDTVLITTEEMGLHRQMRQRINVDVNQVPLDAALKKLARTHAISLVIDPKVMKEAQSPVSLQLDDATLETTVRLLAEMGGLKSVRLGNVLFVTNEAKADKLRQEEKQNPAPDPRLPPALGGMAFPGFGGMGGAGVVPPPLRNVAPPNPPAPPPEKAVPDRNVPPAPNPASDPATGTVPPRPPAPPRPDPAEKR